MFEEPASEEERERVAEVISDRLAEEEDIQLAYLHGSFLSSMYEDIDVAILVSEDEADTDLLRRSLRLSGELTRSLGLGVEVDVRTLNDAPLPFRFEVLRKGRRLLARDEERRVAYETETIRSFHDFRHHLDNYRREVLGAGT